MHCQICEPIKICKDYIIPIATLIAAIWIPIKIKWEQLYTSLLNEFRSYDYAIAYQGIVQFFVNECHNDVDLIKDAYKQRFIKEIEEIEDTEKKSRKNINKENCLHFQRRLLAQFFWQLNQCVKSHVISKKRITRDFTSSEAKLIKILIYMGEAVLDDDILYKDISSSAIVKSPRHMKGQNKALSELYQTFRSCKRYMY